MVAGTRDKESDHLGNSGGSAVIFPAIGSRPAGVERSAATAASRRPTPITRCPAWPSDSPVARPVQDATRVTTVVLFMRNTMTLLPVRSIQPDLAKAMTATAMAQPAAQQSGTPLVLIRCSNLRSPGVFE